MARQILITGGTSGIGAGIAAAFAEPGDQVTVTGATAAEVDAATGGRVVTEVEPERHYWRAEDYHQHYFANHPGQGYCAFVVAPKVEKFRKTFAERVRDA